MQQRASEPGSNFSDIPGVDPYIDWAFGAGSQFHVFADKDQEWLPVLMEFRKISTRSFATMARERIARAEEAVIQFSDVYTDPPAGLEDSPYGTALVTRTFFEQLRSEDWLRESVAVVTLGPSVAPAARRRSQSDAS